MANNNKYIYKSTRGGKGYGPCANNNRIEELHNKRAKLGYLPPREEEELKTRLALKYGKEVKPAPRTPHKVEVKPHTPRKVDTDATEEARAKARCEAYNKLKTEGKLTFFGTNPTEVKVFRKPSKRRFF